MVLLVIHFDTDFTEIFENRFTFGNFFDYV